MDELLPFLLRTLLMIPFFGILFLAFTRGWRHGSAVFLCAAYLVFLFIGLPAMGHTIMLESLGKGLGGIFGSG